MYPINYFKCIEYQMIDRILRDIQHSVFYFEFMLI